MVSADQKVELKLNCKTTGEAFLRIKVKFHEMWKCEKFEFEFESTTEYY